MGDRELLDSEHAMPSRCEMIQSGAPHSAEADDNDVETRVSSGHLPLLGRAVAVCCWRIRLPVHLDPRYWRRLTRGARTINTILGASGAISNALAKLLASRLQPFT